MDEFDDFPALVELRKVLTPENPQFILEDGQLRHRGYFISLEVWNVRTRIHVAFPAKGLGGGHPRFRLLGDEGQKYAGIVGPSATAENDLMSFYSLSFEPLQHGTTEVKAEIAIVPAGVVVEDASELDSLWSDMGKVSI
ncbi:hypothetical protein [Arthrobacter sp. 260]|uniref:hypothetical protein n=1 Tax=Arthrobacter sp. 260 TaxID=2735314 RepID=UPI0014931FE0|nr:hypothetical protein [Arthrobacter sp. 260]NOJ59733.1 hypothetical protein [Arthrobacter sp. 260]